MLDGITVGLLILIAGQVLRRTVVAAVRRQADAQVHALTRNVLTIFTWVFAIAGGLVAGGVDVLWVLTFGGIFSLAIGLAFQDLLRNILAGIFILLEKPFRIGDHVAIGDCEGVVQTIALRTTALRTGDRRLAVMPNLTVFTSVILNSTAYDQRRYSVSLPVEPDTDRLDWRRRHGVRWRRSPGSPAIRRRASSPGSSRTGGAWSWPASG